jgi:uncharacterized protein (DUF1015 family)
MASDARSDATPGAADIPETRRPFVLAPFRGLRFDPETVGDLGTVISPPYDVLDADTVRDLEAANRHNIVRLILSRRFERPYQAVRRRLERWRSSSYLRADDQRGLYLYQYTADGATVRGLIGLAALRDEAERVILPHEDVMTAAVEDRAVLMRTTQTNLEPILLVHEGTTRLRDLVGAAAVPAPEVHFKALDGSEHRLWRVVEPGLLQAIAAELAPTNVLIADGHHRYAAYLRLQRQMRDPAARTDESPWDFGLALLVDQHDYPLRVGPIYRSVSAVTIADVREAAVEHGDDFTPCLHQEAAFAEQAVRSADPKTASFVVSDGRAWGVLTTAHSDGVDAVVLHRSVLPSWHVTDEQVGYHHGLDQALHTTARQPGIVIAVQPPTPSEVMAAAEQGERMPRKSTSFAPKPSMGVVMRDLRDS